MAMVEDTWCHHEACVEAKRSREDGVSIRGSSKKMDKFTPAWVRIIVNSIGVFSSFTGTVYREAWLKEELALEP